MKARDYIVQREEEIRERLWVHFRDGGQWKDEECRDCYRAWFGIDVWSDIDREMLEAWVKRTLPYGR